MRNILIQGSIAATTGAQGVETLEVQGVAFGVEQVQVSVECAGTVSRQVVEVGPDGGWSALFDRARGSLTEACARGGKVRVEAGDATDPKACYSSVEAELPVEARRR